MTTTPAIKTCGDCGVLLDPVVSGIHRMVAPTRTDNHYITTCTRCCRKLKRESWREIPIPTATQRKDGETDVNIKE